MKHAIVVLACVALASAARAEESYAQLRSGTRVAITEVAASGIKLASDRGRPERVESLALVKSVAGPLSAEFEKHRSLANDLWRASARLAREDEGGAEPIYEKLWSLTSGVSGPTRAEIACGLATCRVHRGALATAIEPWAEWIRQSGSLSPDQLGTQRARLGISDSSGNWIDTMPPMWSDSTAVRALASMPLPAASSGDRGGAAHPTGEDLFTIFVVAARRDTGQPWQIDPVRALKDPAWNNLAGEMVLAESEVPEVRIETRTRLAARLGADVPLWKQVWVRLALGRSLMLEPGADDRRAGVLNLLWIASRPAAPSALTAIALANAAKGLVLLADLDGARSLLTDLERRFPGDPSLDTPVVASVRRAVALAQPATTIPAPVTVPPSDKD